MKLVGRNMRGLMTYEKIAEEIYDELQHNKILNYEEYSERLYKLLDKAHPNEEKVGNYVGDVEDILHNRWSYGFCDMCGEYINYDDDPWYDVCLAEPEEREILEETLPIFQRKVGHEIQEVCPSCWHKLLKKGDK